MIILYLVTNIITEIRHVLVYAKSVNNKEVCSYKSILKQHIKMIRTEIKPFICPVCDKDSVSISIFCT